MQKAAFVSFVQERESNIALRAQLEQSQARAAEFDARNGKQAAELRSLQKQLAQAQYKLKRQCAERDEIIRKVACMQQDHAERCTRLTRVGPQRSRIRALSAGRTCFFCRTPGELNTKPGILDRSFLVW